MLLLLSLGCTVDKDKAAGKVYACDVSSSDTGACGQGYGCSGSGRQLGGTDFCAPICMADTESTVCGENKLALTRCRPSDDATCGDGLGCIRTNLLADEGVCMPIQTCSRNEDCRDPIRSQCFSVIGETYRDRGRTDVKADHLICLQANCDVRGSQCLPGNTCLRKEFRLLIASMKDLYNSLKPPFYDLIVAALEESLNALPDVCAPDCDAQGGCPPNFVCTSKTVPWWTSPPLCLPGLNGAPCNSDLDCFAGSCLPDRKVCATPCQTSADCKPFASDTDDTKFSCIDGRCIDPMACDVSHACPSGQSCIFNRCTPTFVGLPCVSDAECPASLGLSCLPSANRFVWKECTKACNSDDQCPQIFTLHSYCDTRARICQPGSR